MRMRDGPRRAGVRFGPRSSWRRLGPHRVFAPERGGPVAVLRRRAQRRRRQPRRPQGRARAALRRSDHHRRQGDPGVAGPRRALGAGVVDPGRGVPAHGRRVRGLASPSGRCRPARPATCCWPCAAAARACTSASPRTATSSPASRTGSSRRRGATSASTARAAGSSCASTPAAPGRLDGITRLAYDGGALPVTDGRRRPGRGHHPRHRPRRFAALPAQGDQRVAGELRQDAARQDRRDRRRAAPRRGRHAGLAGRHRRPARRRHDHARAGHRSGHRRRRRGGDGQDARRAVGGRARRRRDHGHRAVRLRAHARHARHAGRRRQPERHHDRHQPHRRPAEGRAARPCWRSSIAARATSPTRPTACCTRPTVATSR